LGANVVVTGRNGDNVKRVANICQSVSPKGLKALEVIADITNDDDAKNLIDSTVNEFGKIDVLVNNAGAGWLTSIYDNNLMDNYEKIMRIDLRSVVYLSHLAVPYLEKTKGNIVNISSGAGLKPFIGFMVYCMAKSALDMFTKCLAIELGPKGVRVNSLNSGVVKTNFVTTMGLDQEKVDKMYEKTAIETPLRIVGEPQDIANSVAFLASNDASFITGITMVVDGGIIFTNFSLE